MFEYIWIYWNIFEYIRITYYSYSYSVIFSDRIIFVFVFGGNFLTNSIRIRIRWKIFDEYYSYSYSVKKNWRIIFVFVFGIFFWTNTIRIRIRSSKNYSLTSELCNNYFDFFERYFWHIQPKMVQQSKRQPGLAKVWWCTWQL